MRSGALVGEGVQGVSRHRRPTMGDVTPGLPLSSSRFPFPRACTAVRMSGADEQGVSRRDLIKTTAGLAAAVSAVAPLVGLPKVAEAKGPAWVQVRHTSPRMTSMVH